MKEGRLCANGQPIVPRARRTEGPFERARGLLARPSPTPGEALLLAPCSGVHTCAMSYPIDVLFLERGGRVLKVVADLVPWRFASCAGAHTVVEMAAGEAKRLGIATGMHLEWQEAMAESR